MQIRIVRLDCCLISNRKEGITPADSVNPPPTLTKMAKKNAENYKKNANYHCRFPLKCSRSSSSSTTKMIVIQSAAVGVFALGFIDAGYSGDWSRIGVISRGAEDLLKTSAFFVVPFCLLLILISLSRITDDDIEG